MPQTLSKHRDDQECLFIFSHPVIELGQTLETQHNLRELFGYYDSHLVLILHGDVQAYSRQRLLIFSLHTSGHFFRELVLEKQKSFCVWPGRPKIPSRES